MGLALNNQWKGLDGIRKSLIVLIVIILGVIFIISSANFIKAAKAMSDDVLKIKGISIISDKNFKRELLQYLSLDVKRDYRNIYKYLSSGYISRYYKSVKNANEFERIEAKGGNELVVLDYLNINGFKIINKYKYQVDLIRKDGFEGNEYIKKVRYYFINEKNIWKLDDSALLEDLSSQNFGE